MTKIYNQSSEKQKRQILRNGSTQAERLLWARLRGEQLQGFKFRRQYSVGGFVVDFYCPACKLAVELDGASHYLAGAPEYDAERQRYIESFGIRFLRFDNNAVYTELDRVVAGITAVLMSVKVR